MVAKKSTAKKTTAKARKAAEADVATETTATARRGRQPDMGKYELFAEWAMEEHGVKVDPKQAAFVILNYKDFQVSDVNKEYNESKRTARAEAASEKSERTAKKTTAKKTTAAKKTASKRSAAAESAPVTTAKAGKKKGRKTAAATEAF